MKIRTDKIRDNIAALMELFEAGFGKDSREHERATSIVAEINRDLEHIDQGNERPPTDASIKCDVCGNPSMAGMSLCESCAQLMILRYNRLMSKILKRAAPPYELSIDIDRANEDDTNALIDIGKMIIEERWCWWLASRRHRGRGKNT